MITIFKIYEKLSYNEDISLLSDYIWEKYKQGDRLIYLNEFITKNNIKLKLDKILIEVIYDKNDVSIMSVDVPFFIKHKYYKIIFNKYWNLDITILEHEIKHIYDYIKQKGYYKTKDIKKYHPFLFVEEKTPYIKDLLYIIYIISQFEIEAYFQQDIKNYKKNPNKFKNFKTFLTHSRTYINYQYLINSDIDNILNNISKKDKNDIINIYNECKNNMNLFDNLEGFKSKYEDYKDDIKTFLQKIKVLKNDYKNYSDEEINNFFNEIKKDIEYKKKIHLKYISKMYSFFN